MSIYSKCSIKSWWMNECYTFKIMEINWRLFRRERSQRKGHDTKEHFNNIRGSVIQLTIQLLSARDFSFFPNFKLFILYWGIADWQCCSSFRWIVKGLSHIHTCIHCLPNLLPTMLPHIIEQSSICYTIIGLCCQPGTSKDFIYIALIYHQSNSFSFTVIIAFSYVKELRQRGTKFPQGHTQFISSSWGVAQGG